MSVNLKDNETLKDLIRYMNNKMSNEERYAFERALERDPFLAEAYEGMNEFKSSDIEKDLHAINLITGKSKRKVRPLVYLSVAASILILIGLIFLFNNPQNEQLVSEIEKDEILEDLEVDSFLFAEKSVDTISAEGIESERILLAEAKDLSTNNRKAEPTKNSIVQRSQDKKQITETKPIVEADIYVEEPLKMAAMQVTADDVIEGNRSSAVRSKSIDSFIAKQEFTNSRAVETVIDDNNNVEKQTKKFGVNAKAEPLGGTNLFDTYIDNNIQYPEAEEEINRKVVRVRFTVSEMGIPSNYTIVRAPENDDFSTEAIRLIKEGPRWSPTIKDGLPIEDEIVLRIVFKP